MQNYKEVYRGNTKLNIIYGSLVKKSCTVRDILHGKQLLEYDLTA